MDTQSEAEQLRQRNQELAILNDIARALNKSVDLQQALNSVLAQVATLLDVHAGWIWLFDEESGGSYLAAAQNLPPVLVEKPQKMEGSCYCLDIYRDGDLEAAANVNVIRCSRLTNVVSGTAGLLYHASVPLYVHGKQLGVLNVASADWREISETDLRLLYTIGDMLGIAIERARYFSRSVQLGAVEERNRLAREIHDTLAQGLTAITLRLESADALLEQEAALEKVQHSIQAALELTRTNLQEVRRSVLDLRAAPLEGRSLPEAIQSLCAELAERNQLSIDFSCTGENHPLPIRIEAGIYRIVQEALNNVVKHAQAKLVLVELLIHNEQLSLTVVDDGIGFAQEQIVGDRFGLVGLNERARLLGGRLHLETAIGSGTRLEVTVPIA